MKDLLMRFVGHTVAINLAQWNKMQPVLLAACSAESFAIKLPTGSLMHYPFASVFSVLEGEQTIGGWLSGGKTKVGLMIQLTAQAVAGGGGGVGFGVSFEG